MLYIRLLGSFPFCNAEPFIRLIYVNLTGLQLSFRMCFCETKWLYPSFRHYLNRYFLYTVHCTLYILHCNIFLHQHLDANKKGSLFLPVFVQVSKKPLSLLAILLMAYLAKVAWLIEISLIKSSLTRNIEFLTIGMHTLFSHLLGTLNSLQQEYKYHIMKMHRSYTMVRWGQMFWPFFRKSGYTSRGCDCLLYTSRVAKESEKQGQPHYSENRHFLLRRLRTWCSRTYACDATQKLRRKLASWPTFMLISMLKTSSIGNLHDKNSRPSVPLHAIILMLISAY